MTCFNGATTNQLWKQCCSFVWQTQLHTASMEPQQISCGNSRLQSQRKINLISFNGATTNQLWKLEPLGTSLRGALGFNGATTNQLWKLDRRPKTSDAKDGLLQWSHNKSVVETRVDISRKCQHCGFNGATTNQLWKRSFVSLVTRSNHSLQWSHNKSVVETPL